MLVSTGIGMSFRYVYLRPVYYELERNHLDTTAYQLARDAIDEYSNDIIVPVFLLFLYAIVITIIAFRLHSRLPDNG